MKSGAALMAGTALLASFGVHLAGFAMMPAPDVLIEGGAPMQLAMLGNSFEDVSTGTVSPTAPEDVAETVDEAVPMQPALPEVREPVTVPEQMQTPPPTVTAFAVVESLSNPVVPMLAAPAIPVSSLALQPAVAATSAPPETMAALAPANPLETLTAEAPVEVQQATPDTRRPVTRPAKPTTPQRTRTVTAPPKPKGGQAAQRGQADGSSTGQAASSSRQGTRSTAAGNAAASNYPGLVQRKISRARRGLRYNGQRGTAWVRFKISASGALTSVGVSKSSGSAKIDSIATRIVQRASPFPRPPKGARRSFRIPIEVRR